MKKSKNDQWYENVTMSSRKSESEDEIPTHIQEAENHAEYWKIPENS